MRRLLALIPLIGLVLAFAPVSPASAQTGSSIVATVAGTTEGGSTCAPDPSSSTGWRELDTGNECDPDNDTATGKFNGVVLTGDFTAVDGTDAATCAGEVVITTGDGSVGFTENNNVLTANGTLQNVDFAGGGPNCTITGKISGGAYVRVGTVASASIFVLFEVCTTINPPGITICAEGSLLVMALVSAIPGAGDPPGDPASAQVEGVVHGADGAA